MAFTNAYYSVISTKFSEGAKRASKLPFLANTTWEGDAINGEVKIISVGDATLRTYTPGTPITVDTGSATANVLKLDQFKYFAHDVDSTESLTPGYLAKYAEKALAASKLQNDAYVLGLAPSFTTNKITGAADAAINVNSANILDIIRQAAALLRKQDALTENAFIALPAEWGDIVEKAATNKYLTSADSYFATGEVPKIAGLNVVLTNSYVIASDTATILFGSPDAVADAMSIGNLETITELENSFGVRTKCLVRYGAKVVEEKMGGMAKLKRIAEV